MNKWGSCPPGNEDQNSENATVGLSVDYWLRRTGYVRGVMIAEACVFDIGIIFRLAKKVKSPSSFFYSRDSGSLLDHANDSPLTNAAISFNVLRMPISYNL